VILLVIVFVVAGCCHCGDICRENADFFETMKHYSPEEVGMVLQYGGELQGYKAKHYP
jgi:hypothetical protein